MKFLTIATPEYDFSFWYVGTRAGAPTIAPTTTTYNHYTLLCMPALLYTTTPRAGSNVVRLRSASDGILCAAKFIGESISFEVD